MNPSPNGFWCLIPFLDAEDHVDLIRLLQIVHVNAVLNIASALGLSRVFFCSLQMCLFPTGKQDSSQARWCCLGEVHKMVIIGKSVLFGLRFPLCCSSFLNM